MKRAQENARLLQQLVCGDLAEDDPRVAAALDAEPRLRAELQALRAAQRQWADLVADADDLAAAPPTAADRARVAAALRPPRRWLRRPAMALLAAALLVSAALFLWTSKPAAPRRDSALGGSEAVRIERDGEAVRVRIQEQLPPGESYHLRLEVDGRVARTAVSEQPDWTFPRAWTLDLASAATARLVVECRDQDGLAIVHIVPLK